MSSSRTAQCGTAEARSRLRTARAYLEVAALVLDERDRDEYLNVSAGLAVLAGIAGATSMVTCMQMGQFCARESAGRCSSVRTDGMSRLSAVAIRAKSITPPTLLSGPC
jgi:hypothetical protein